MSSVIGADHSHRVRAARASFAFWLNDQVSESALSSAELLQAAGKVAELMEHPGWVLLSALIEARRDRLMDGLVHGQIVSKSEYAAQTGMASGLDQALHLGQAIVEFARERESQLQAEARAEAEREGMGDG